MLFSHLSLVVGGRQIAQFQTKLIGREKLAGQALLSIATYNLVRIGSLTGWWDAKHV